MGKHDARSIQDLTPYSTDDLRYLYHQIEAESDDVLIRLSVGVVSREELVTEIRQRVRRERFRKRLMAGVKMVGFIVVVVAAATGVVLVYW